MIFCVSIFIFCLEPKVREQLDESDFQPLELGKKYDGNFIFTFAVVKVRYGGITTTKVFKYGNYLKQLLLLCFLLLDCFYTCSLVFYLCFKSYYFINHKYIT